MTSGSDKFVLIPFSPHVHDDRIQWVLGIVGFGSNIVSMKWGHSGDSDTIPVVGQMEYFSWIRMSYQWNRVTVVVLSLGL